MPVRCLTDQEKSKICMFYNQRMMNQKEIAQYFAVSERTIHRVLEEYGYATPVARLQEEANKALKLLREYGVKVSELDEILTNHMVQKQKARKSKIQKGHLHVPL